MPVVGAAPEHRGQHQREHHHVGGDHQRLGRTARRASTAPAAPRTAAHIAADISTMRGHACRRIGHPRGHRRRSCRRPSTSGVRRSAAGEPGRRPQRGQRDHADDHGHDHLEVVAGRSAGAAGGWPDGSAAVMAVLHGAAGCRQPAGRPSRTVPKVMAGVMTSEQAEGAGAQRGLGAVAGAELGQHVGDVVLHRALGQEQRRRRSPGCSGRRRAGAAPSSSRSDSGTTSGCGRGGTGSSAGSRANRATTFAATDGCSTDSPRGRGEHRLHQPGRRHVLEQVADRARPQRGEDVLVVVERGQRDHPHARAARPAAGGWPRPRPAPACAGP